MDKKIKVGVIGATGMVGQNYLEAAQPASVVRGGVPGGIAELRG